MPLQYVEARRGRRGHPISPERIRRLKAIVDEVSHASIAITARHLYYLLVVRDMVEKTESAYQRVLADLLDLRRAGDVPWSAITDGTRTKTRWIGYGSLAEAATEWQRTHRRDIWRDARVSCEVWTESRGLLATINEVAADYGVTTIGVGGFNSASVGYETARDVIRAARQLVRDAIESVLPEGALEVARVAEESERATLANIVATMGASVE